MSKNNSIAFREITSGPYAFLWQVAEKGYKLATESSHKLLDDQKIDGKPINVIDSQPPWLVRKGNVVLSYSPLSDFILHRRFAQLDSDASILNFANQFGMLGRRSVMLCPQKEGKLIEGANITSGESVEQWRQAICEMGGLMAIWDLVRTYDGAKKLSWIVYWTEHTVQIDGTAEYDDTQKRWEILKSPGNNIYPRNPKKVEVSKEELTWQYLKENFYSRPRAQLNGRIASVNFNKQLYNRWIRGEVLEPAKYYVIHEVNNHLHGYINPKLLLPSDEDDLPSKLYLFPDDLLTALWVLFLMELIGEIKTQQCDFCGRWREVATNRSITYCNNACKQAAYRRKHSKKKINKRD